MFRKYNLGNYCGDPNRVDFYAQISYVNFVLRGSTDRVLVDIGHCIAESTFGDSFALFTKITNAPR